MHRQFTKNMSYAELKLQRKVNTWNISKTFFLKKCNNLTVEMWCNFKFGELYNKYIRRYTLSIVKQIAWYRKITINVTINNT